jgi:hypothetical protein
MRRFVQNISTGTITFQNVEESRSGGGHRVFCGKSTAIQTPLVHLFGMNLPHRKEDCQFWVMMVSNSTIDNISQKKSYNGGIEMGIE